VPAQADERGAPAGVEPEAPELRRGERRERARRRRRGEPAVPRARRAHDRPFELPRAMRLDQLAAERPQECARDGGDAKRPEAAELPDGTAEHRVATEAPEELGVVVVEGGDPAEPLDAVVGLRAHDDGPLRSLPRLDDLVLERAREYAVAELARSVGREARGQRERKRPAGSQDAFDHAETLVIAAAGTSTLSGVSARETWDALASDPDLYVGDPARGRAELESLFGRLGADPRGGTCVEVGCGPGRMTGGLAERFDRVVGVDVSPAMLEQARAAVPAENVEFRLVSGDRLDSLEDDSADVLVCYLVLQHLASREVVLTYLSEFARVLAPAGAAFVQVPVLDATPQARAWRALRSALVPLTASAPTRRREFRGFRLTRRELDAGLARAGLRVLASDVGPEAPYRFSRDLFLRLAA
jgi:SAM-dependent methyltransferase